MGTNVTRTLCTCGSISVIPVFKTEILLSFLEVDLHVLVTISAHFGASLVNLKFPVCSQINQIFLFLFGSLYYYSIISSIVSISQKSSEGSSWDLLLNSSPSFVNRSPPGRRRITARLGAPPTCGAFRSLRNPKKLWSRWLRRKVETKARSRVARKIKVPKKSVSFVSNRTKCFAFFLFYLSQDTYIFIYFSYPAPAPEPAKVEKTSPSAKTVQNGNQGLTQEEIIQKKREEFIRKHTAAPAEKHRWAGWWHNQSFYPSHVCRPEHWKTVALWGSVCMFVDKRLSIT